MREPVDAVITWVDGNEKAHADKLANCFAQLGIVHRTEASSPTRFNPCGEITYCVKSILRFAPWIRSIYIVTDAQTPSIIEEFLGTPQESKIKLIDHLDIFRGYENCLPTFNSMVIEGMIWRIEGLSNQFIYLNDDCVFARPVEYQDFFRDNKLVLRGNWRVQSDKKWASYLQKVINKLLNRPHQTLSRELFRIVQENSATMAGWHKHFFQFPHAPFPLKKELFEDYFHEHPDVWLNNLHYPIRDDQQFWPLSLIQHLEMKRNQVVFDNSLETVMVNAGCHSMSKIQKRLERVDTNKKVAFVCLQSVDEAPRELQTKMMSWLEKKIA